MVTVFGRAKINLTLDILGVRDDGYHEIATVMQSLALADTLTLSRRTEGIALHVDVPGLTADAQNLAYRAAALIMAECGVRGGVHIDIRKRIPIAAGLAGGSADAAATLRGMNALYDLRCTDAELCALGARLGSDIPFSLVGGTVLATGRGEVMERLFDFPETVVLLAKPPVAVSTAPMTRTRPTRIQTTRHFCRRWHGPTCGRVRHWPSMCSNRSRRPHIRRSPIIARACAPGAPCVP